MNKVKKLLALVFALVCIIAIAAFSSSAAEAIEVDTWDELKAALKTSDTAEIVLTKDISGYSENYYYCTGVYGKKTLDLNGHKLVYKDYYGKNDRQFLDKTNHDYLFYIPGGNSLTINDTSAAKTGMIWFDGYLYDDAMDYVMPPIRDMFDIEGTLVINGGIYEIGHVEKDWVTALRVNGSLYTGYINQQVYGSVFNLRGVLANLEINGGTFTARGGISVFDRTTPGSYTGAVVKAGKNTTVTVNYAEMFGRGGANIFDAVESATIDVKNIVMETSGQDKVLVNHNDIVAGNITKGSLGLSGEAIVNDIEKKVIIRGGEIYTFAKNSYPGWLKYTTDNTSVYTAIGYKSQSPAMPVGKSQDSLGQCNVDYNKTVSFEEQALNPVLANLGVSLQSNMVIRDSSNNIIYAVAASGPKSYNFKNANPGTYTITEQISLTYKGKVIAKHEDTFYIEMFKSCSHTYTTISNTATCEEAGVKTERCTACGEEKITNVEALEHLSLASDWTYNSTHHWYYCRRCYTPLTIQAHSWISSTNRTCSSCRYNDNCEWGNAMDTEYDENYHWWPCDTHAPDEACPNNHQLERELHTVCSIENTGTLEHPAETEYSCQNGYVCDGCGEYFGATGEHKWVQVPLREGGLRVATCIADGYIKYKCEYDGKYDCKGNKITCSATKTITIPATGHSFDYDNPTSCTATCTEDGYYTYTCTGRACTATTTKPVSALDHIFNYWEVKTPATCETDGVSEVACIRTGCTHKDTMTISATGHTFGMAETTVAPDCANNGLNVATCTAENCNATQEEVIPATGEHAYADAVTKATLTKNGKVENKCSVCGNVKSTTTVYYPKTIKLSKTAYTYNGKVQTPSVTVKDSKGNTLKKDTDYTVKYESGRKAAGKYTVTITFKGKYTGTKKLTYTIAPKATTKVTASQTTTTITLKWNKVTGADGYRVYKYDTKKKKYVKVKDVTKTTLKISHLKAGTKYKYKVRAYTKDDGTIWGDYSKVFETATKCKTPKITKLTTTKGKASFTWSNVSGESGYQVYYSTKKDSSFKKLASYKTNVVKGSKSKLTRGKTYYFKVRAYTKTDSGTVYSAWSAVKNVKVK